MEAFYCFTTEPSNTASPPAKPGGFSSTNDRFTLEKQYRAIDLFHPRMHLSSTILGKHRARIFHEFTVVRGTGLLSRFRIEGNDRGWFARNDARKVRL